MKSNEYFDKLEEQEREAIKKEKKYQVCILTLSDGTVCRYIGRVQISYDDTRTISKFEITDAIDLPENTYFEKIGE